MTCRTSKRIDYPHGFFTELVREHQFPPLFNPQPWEDKPVSNALAEQRARNLAKGRVQKGRTI